MKLLNYAFSSWSTKLSCCQLLLIPVFENYWLDHFIHKPFFFFFLGHCLKVYEVVKVHRDKHDHTRSFEIYKSSNAQDLKELIGRQSYSKFLEKTTF